MSDYYRVFVCPKERLYIYQNMIIFRWKKALRKDNPFFAMIDPVGFGEWYDYYIPAVIKRPDCKVRLAVLGDDEDVALGFSVSRGPVLDFVHVHKDQKGLGIGQNLIPNGIESFTHLTTHGKRLWKQHYPCWKFNPFL